MKKKIIFVFVFLILMVLASTFLGSYSSVYSSNMRAKVAGSISSINYEDMSIIISVPGWPYSWDEQINVTSRTKITSISCNDNKPIKSPMDFIDLQIGMIIEAATIIDDIASYIVVNLDDIPCK